MYIVISSCCHFVTLSYYHVIVLSACHVVMLSCYLLSYDGTEEEERQAEIARKKAEEEAVSGYVIMSYLITLMHLMSCDVMPAAYHVMLVNICSFDFIAFHFMS